MVVGPGGRDELAILAGLVGTAVTQFAEVLPHWAVNSARGLRVAGLIAMVGAFAWFVASLIGAP